MLTKVLLKPNFLSTKMQSQLGWLAKVIRTIRQSAKCTFYGKVAVAFLTCDRRLLSGVTLQISS